jgi:hemerythrin
MPLIKWTPQLSVDVPLIDDQHKQLIAIANGLIKAMHRGLNSRVINNVIRRLREYTVFHFSSEEKLMEEVCYPKRGEHANEHRRLKEQVKQYQQKIYYKENPNPDAVTDFIKTWLLKHILESDRKLANFIHEQAKKEAEKGKAKDQPQPSEEPA